LAPRRTLPEAFCTERLLAERLDERHLDLLVSFNADPEVMDWLGGTGTADESAVWLAGRVATHWGSYGFGLYALFTDAGPGEAGGTDGPGDSRYGTFVGRAGLRHYEIEGVDEIELLYALAPPCWGRGYATEIGRALLDLGFAWLAATSVIAYTMPHNRRSRRVLEKLGFSYERDFIHGDEPHVLYRRRRPADCEGPPTAPQDSPCQTPEVPT
jgi:[ribosomal protein S5]-alanine N-acetyltransferase